MKIIHNTQSIKTPFVSICIGNFDGCHLGHRQLLSLTTSLAKKNKGQSVICTFFPHPSTFFNQSKDFFLIDPDHSLLKEKIGSEFEIDFLVEYHFDKKFSKLNATEFLNLVFTPLTQTTKKHLCIGYDFSCGHNREGSQQKIKEYCKKNHIDLSIIPPYKVKNDIVSSTFIRDKIKKGHIQTTTNRLSRPLSIKGIVQKGQQIGQSIGFPTANLHPDPYYPLPFGVYIVSALKNKEVLKGVANWGKSPTLKNGAPLFEIHFLNFNDNLYKKELTIFIHHFLRKEKKFQSKEQLKKQIKIDFKRTYQYFLIDMK